MIMRGADGIHYTLLQLGIVPDEVVGTEGQTVAELISEDLLDYIGVFDIADAWFVVGPRPKVHFGVMSKFNAMWPTLYRAVSKVVRG